MRMSYLVCKFEEVVFSDGDCMKILAVDASGQVASVAVATENGILAEYSVDYLKTHSQTLLPMSDEVLRMTDTDKQEIDAIAVSEGPGSFTGLRIGVATVKGLAAALRKPVIAVPTLQMLAGNFLGNSGLICPMMDARRNQVYTAVYRCEGEELVPVIAQKACALEEILAELNALEQPVVLLGDGVDAYKAQIQAGLTGDYRLAALHRNRQRAGSLATIALQKAKNGQMIPGSELVPEYLRLSQAERERMEREQQ